METKECDQVVIVGASLPALELTLQLDKKQWQPILLCTHMILPSYFDCRKGDNAPDLNPLFDELVRRNIPHSSDHWIQGLEMDNRTGLFRLATNKTIHVAKCVIFCSDTEMKKYKEYAKHWSGVFVCPDMKSMPAVLDDVSCHLQMSVDTFHQNILEPSPKHESPDTMPALQRLDTKDELNQVTVRKWWHCCCR